MDRPQALTRYLVGLLAIGWARPIAFALAALGSLRLVGVR